MANYLATFDGQVYDDPREELRARAERARKVGDRFVAIPNDLIDAVVNIRPCKSTTMIRGARETNTMIQILCERNEHGATGHRNGKIFWD